MTQTKVAREKEPTYAYKHLELALAGVFGVPMKDLPAFRARLRHLRNLGVPAIGAPGSGQKVRYGRDDAIQVLIALEAELLGLPPKLAAAFSRNAMHDLARKADRAAKVGERLFVSVDPRFAFDLDESWIYIGRVGKAEAPAAESVHRRKIVNLATSIALLDAELARATPFRDPDQLMRGRLGKQKRRV